MGGVTALSHMFLKDISKRSKHIAFNNASMHSIENISGGFHAVVYVFERCKQKTYSFEYVSMHSM